MRRFKEPYRGNIIEKVYVTPREQETLRLLCAGLSDGEIAAAMKISEHTVTTRLAVMRGVAGVRSSRELIAWGWRNPEALRRGVTILRDAHDPKCECWECQPAA